MKRIRWTTLLLFAVALPAGLACDSKQGGGPTNPNPPPPPPFEISLVPVASGFSNPVFMTSPPGDSRLFVVQQNGLIRIVRNGLPLDPPFLDISALTSDGYERGLLGMAFRPDFASSRRYYVCYTAADGDVVVARYRASNSNPDVSMANADSIVLRIEHSANDDHNGGMLAFGPDGMLYMSIGDGGGSGDPFQSGQDPSDLLGSILRLNVSGNGATVPADNPRGNAVWSWGLRNPWRFSFDRLTGDLYIGDVGEGAWEEVNVATAISGRGRDVNYGWPIREGTRCYEAATCASGGLTPPVHEYAHDGDEYCIIGGYVYRGPSVPALQGHYFYGDVGSTQLKSFRYVAGVATEKTTWNVTLNDPPLSFAQDNQGELYVLTSGGQIFRIGP